LPAIGLLTGFLPNLETTKIKKPKVAAKLAEA